MCERERVENEKNTRAVHHFFLKSFVLLSPSSLSLNQSIAMDSPCDYEEDRARRIAENMKRLAELGVVEVRKGEDDGCD